MIKRSRTTRQIWISTFILALISASPSLVLGNGKYTVRSGDTVWDIARKQKVSVDSILRANGLKEKSTLKVGASLIIPGKTAAKPQAKAAAPAPTCKPVSAAGFVSADGTHLRSGPSTKHPSVAQLRRGTPVQIIASCGTWRKVVVSGGTKGFIYRPLLDVGSLAPSQSVASSAPSTSNSELIRTAMACRGARYRRGGTSRGGFDCSGFTRYVFAKYGISLPHSSAAQAKLGTPVSRGELAEGDLVFFQTYRAGVSHVGIYIGDNKFVHASTPRGGVRVDALSHSYYASRYRGARRVK